MGIHIDHIAGFHFADIHFNRQGAGVFHGIKENRRNFASETIAAIALVRNIRNVVTHMPEHGIGRRFTRRPGANDIADISNRMPEALELAYLLQWFVSNALTWIFQHGIRMQWYVGTRPGILGRRQIIGIGFTGNLENRYGNFVGQRWFTGKPVSVGPGLEHPGSMSVTRF